MSSNRDVAQGFVPHNNISIVTPALDTDCQKWPHVQGHLAHGLNGNDLLRRPSGDE